MSLLLEFIWVVTWPSTLEDIPEPSHGRVFREKFHSVGEMIDEGCLKLAHRSVIKQVFLPQPPESLVHILFVDLFPLIINKYNNVLSFYENSLSGSHLICNSHQHIEACSSNTSKPQIAIENKRQL